MTADRDPKHAASAPRWLGLLAASLGMFLSSLDITVNVALPDITRSFGTDALTVQWIIIFYVGSSTGLQLSLGNAADRYGLKRLYIIGLGIYALAVLLIGVSPWLSMVFACRVLQAVGNGMVLVSAPALVTSLFPAAERGKALGVMTGCAALGMVAGSLGGGVLVDALGWRAIFLVRAPLSALIALVASLVLRASPPQNAPGYDMRGAALLFVGLAAGILFLTLGGRNGWTAPSTLCLSGLSALALSAFVSIEKTVSHPVFDLSLLTHRVIAPLVAAAYLMHLAIFVNWFILPFYVSDILKVDAKALGLLFMLMSVMGTVASPLGGWLSDRLPPACITTLGLMIVSAALWWFTRLGVEASVTQVMWRMLAVGLGMGLFQAANATLIMGSVPSDQLGTGGALLTISRSMGTVSSVALLGALFASRLITQAGALAPPGIAPDVHSTQAFLLAFHDTYWVATGLAGLAVLVSLRYWPQRRQKKVSAACQS